jgi:6-phosphogluconolactonase
VAVSVSASKAEFRVVDDLAEEALKLFMDEAPATVLITGGDTPRPFYERLATRADVDWEETEFFFTDERCVPPADPLSNFGMADEALLSKVPARRYPMNGDTCDADEYQGLLRERFEGELWFDFAVHGLGPDGHTASLFPSRPEVDVADRWVVEVPKAGWEPFVPRLSLTVPALSSASVGVFLIGGAEKREPLRRLLDEEDIPAARISAKRLIILADRAAAG